MPFVRISLFTGRDGTAKAVIAKGIVDVLAEVGGASAEHVQVMFEDVSTHDWAVGPVLAKDLPHGNVRKLETYISVTRISVQGSMDPYLTWRHTVLLRALAKEPGFVGSSLIEDSSGDTVEVSKYASAEAARQIYERLTASGILEQESAYAQRTEQLSSGTVRDVWSA